jgi:excisionase family DNA binding protein
MLSVRDVATRWQMSERGVRNLVARGALRATRFGRLIRFTEEAVVELESTGVPLAEHGERR